MNLYFSANNFDSNGGGSSFGKYPFSKIFFKFIYFFGYQNKLILMSLF